MNKLKNKVAVITGSSRGIGRAIATKFSNEGCNIVINYNKNQKEAKITQSNLSKEVKSIIVKADVGKTNECKKLVDETISRFKKIDILVNCAGINPKTKIENTDEAIFDKLVNINLKGTFFCIKYALPNMKENGRIINLSSVRAFRSRPNMSVYAATKAAVSALTRSLAYDLASKKISVNAIAPGYTDTDMMRLLPKSLLKIDKEKEAVDQFKQVILILYRIVKAVDKLQNHIE